GGSPSRQPGQPQEVQPRHLRNTLLMHRSTLVIERIDLQPAEIEGVARRPHNRGYAGVREMDLANRIDDACGMRLYLASIGLLGKVETLSGGIGIGRVQGREVVRISSCDIVREIGRE